MRVRLRSLLLAEKFSAALRLATILSHGTAKKVRADGVSQFTFSTEAGDTIVFPLRGHIVAVDYPESVRDWAATDLDRLVDTEPVEVEAPLALHEALRGIAPGIDEVVVATDFDREGELIGVEALRAIRAVRPDVPARRARFSAMTPSEVLRAFEGLCDVDWALAEAAATRERIDLAWGAVLTRFLTLACGSEVLLSVGRVQTPTLALVREREQEREGFAPRPFWDVLADIGDPPFVARAAGGPFWDPSGAEAATARAGLGADALVVRLEAYEEREAPPSPMNTTRFLAEASRRGLGTARAMAVAQDLYVRGAISYPRTDNTVYPPSLPIADILLRLRDSSYREHVDRIQSLPEVRPTRGPVSTTDHPPIHPTAAPPRLREPAATVYDIVVRRFLATLLPPATYRALAAGFRIGDADFVAHARGLVESGWRSVIPDERSTPPLPPLQVGDVLALRGLRTEAARTRPPPFHTQGSLIQAMERMGLGTKSTRHEIVALLYRREYIEGRAIRTTGAGRALVDALVPHAPDLTSPGMTRTLEGRMSAIAAGDVPMASVLRDSRDELHGLLAALRENEAVIARWIRDAARLHRDFGPCDACGRGRLVRRRTRTGWSFLGCTEYPRCRRRLRIGRGGVRLPWTLGTEAPLAAP
ncbi:MAG: hypothetical protein A3K66_00730 [Euryarchaeota archaeon RBG_16_67_27]|nr:MAG: hypothetical protein A3K66_00730 [Euryarchaeota archaeon RBG_16_67_27]